MAAVTLVKPVPVKAWANTPCDFLTGGGWIVHNGAKANFGVAGGCKHGSPTWGHLEYQDNGTGLDAHGTAITAYEVFDDGSNGTEANGKPIGARLICGNARTSQFGDVNFALRASDVPFHARRPIAGGHVRSQAAPCKRPRKARAKTLPESAAQPFLVLQNSLP